MEQRDKIRGALVLNLGSNRQHPHQDEDEEARV